MKTFCSILVVGILNLTDLYGSDIVAHWAFDGNTDDAGPSRLHLQADGDVTFGEGVAGGQCILLDGNTWLSIVGDDLLDLQGPFTIEAWIWLNELPGSKSLGIVERIDIRSDTDTRRGYSLYINKDDGSSDSAGKKAGRTRFKVGAGHGPRGKGWVEADSRQPMVTGTWNHIAATFDGHDAHVYVNGVKVGSTGTFQAPNEGIANAGDATTLFGKTFGDVAHCIKGKADELVIRSICLPPDQIAAHYAAVSNPTPSPPEDDERIGFDEATTDYKGYTGWTVSEDPVLPDAEVHPRLWFTKDDVPALRAKRDADDLAGELWARIVNSEFLTIEPQGEDVIMGYMAEFNDPNYKYIQRYYAWLSQIAKYSAFMYVMETDPEQKRQYAERAISVLVRSYDGPIYTFDPRDKTKVDEIYRGTWLQNFCSAYDWVQDALSAEQDTIIRDRLIKEAQLLYENLFIWVPRPHNHLSKPAWGLGSAALCFSSHPNAAKWLERALIAANWNTRYMFSADGMYREGSHYYIFSYINFMPFLYHYRNVSGVDLFPAFQPAFEWPILVRNGNGWMPNLEDGYVKPFPSHTIAAMYRDATSESLNPDVPFADVCAWHHATTDMGVFDRLLEEKEWLFTGASWDYTHWLNEYLTYQPGIDAVRPSVSPTVFMDGGQTVFRNAWDNEDGEQVYCLFQGAAACDNHDHYDHLSFIIHAKNQMMASDSGYGPGGFFKAERKEYNLQPWAHNTVMLNGKYLASREENQTLPSRYRIDTGVFDFEEKQAVFAKQTKTPILYAQGVEGSLKRAIAFPGQAYFIVLDQIEGEEESTAQLSLHGGKGKMKGRGNQRIWEYDEDWYGGRAQMHAWILSHGGRIQDSTGNVVYSKDEEEKHPYIDVYAKGTHIPLMEIIVPVGDGDVPPEVEDLSNENVLAAGVTSDEMTDTFFLQTGNEPVSINGLASDGTFALVRTTSGRPAFFMVKEATFLKYRGKDVLRAKEPATLVIEIRDGYVVTIGSTDPNVVTFADAENKSISATSHYDIDLQVEGNTVRVR